MSPRPAGKLSPEAVIAMLDDPDFCDEARAVIAEAKVLYVQAASYEEFEKQVRARAQPFRDRWGVWPPQTGELLDPDPRRRVVEAIGSGDWGIVPVFPWTTDREIQARVKKIRVVISKRHKDALDARKPQLAAWLQDCGFDQSAIARAIYGRTTGLRRPTKDKAFARAARKDDDLEDKLFEQYQQELRERGVAEADIRKLAEQRVYRTLRGSEAPAHAALRMTDRRYVEQLEELNTNLPAPIESEPLSYALTRLSHEIDKDDATVRQYAIDAKVVFLGDPVEPVASDQPSTGGPHSRQVEAIESGQWGVVPVFPWTTHPDVRARVKSIRSRIRTPRRDRAHPTQAPALSTESEPHSSALTTLFRVLAHEDDAGVKRHAQAVLASFLTAQPS